MQGGFDPCVEKGWTCGPSCSWTNPALSRFIGEKRLVLFRLKLEPSPSCAPSPVCTCPTYSAFGIPTEICAAGAELRDLHRRRLGGQKDREQEMTQSREPAQVQLLQVGVVIVGRLGILGYRRSDVPGSRGGSTYSGSRKDLRPCFGGEKSRLTVVNSARNRAFSVLCRRKDVISIILRR